MTENLHKYARVNNWGALESIDTNQAFIDELVRNFDEFLRDLEDHLSEEERFTPGLLEEGKFTLQEHDQIVQQIIRDQGLGGNALSLPLMLYAMHSWAGVEDLDKYMMPNIPGPIKYLNKNSWFPKWRVCILENYDAVKSNNKEKVVLQYNTGCCGGCCNCCVLL
ncbi:hypothetical protein RFI_25628 [Reticulomyxa filosa]|uniref:Uncharacterized protein n=1 Tax=Reticulomyxa filosa TaxID=46433 RepID=X6MFD1_RETFI|nr:hypothetical protein RFI_25628 [Reticulomyxa filosa]|eukprot:ETO11750.1 hypothetical protein RFI_25628 [Reticulomyxa filosa]